MLVKHGADINALTSDGTTVLDICSNNQQPPPGGSVAFLKQMMDKMSRRNKCPVDVGKGIVELNNNIEQGAEDEVNRLLVDCQISPNDFGTHLPPLHVALNKGNTELMKKLLDNGADVNAKKSEDGNTGLHIAAEQGNKMIVDLLLKKNADVNLKNKKGDSAVNLALNKGRNDIAITLLQHMTKKGN
jgi:ankyrin repeat protein